MGWIDRTRPCKIGTMPAIVVVDGRSRLSVGKVIRFQEGENGKWQTAIVRRLDGDGYFQADRH